MRAERKVLLGDGLGAVPLLLLGASLYGPGIALQHVLGGLSTAVGMGGLLYLSDRGVFAGTVSRTVALVALALLPLAFAGALALTRPALGPSLSLPVAGMGVGVLCNRLVYGFVLPVPEYRLDDGRERAV
ncbi:hypothetical protein ACOZ4N_16745 [Halorientalis pallida]|uniref:hypothetical protein n=1 Tax=Halorientalis pallida TaxID=2479928 RepID=UPI003C6FB266